MIGNFYKVTVTDKLTGKEINNNAPDEVVKVINEIYRLASFFGSEITNKLHERIPEDVDYTYKNYNIAVEIRPMMSGTSIDTI